MVGTIPIVGVSAAEVTSNFEYTLLDDGTIEVTKYVGTDLNVVIPKEIDKKIQNFMSKGYHKLIVASWIVLMIALVFLKFGSSLFA